MVFWNTYPILNVIQSKLNRKLFKSQLFEKDLITSPTGFEGVIINSNQNIIYLPEVRKFIKNNFGSPPTTPILDIPENKLLGEKDYILFVKDKDNNIVGCIRYHYMGIFITDKNQPIYSEDCFCIHPTWRKKGVGDYLLTTLHVFVNKHNIPYSMFLKEGYKLRIINQPFYSSMYVYRQLEYNISHNIQSLSILQAYKLMDIFRELQPKMFIIRNIDSDNQFWKLYKIGTYKILSCIQDTYQTFEEDGKIKKIGWITGWVESSDISDECRESASKEISDSMYGTFDYIWGNIKWIGSNSKSWKIDGHFNWYLYQWITTADIKKSYVIIN